MSKLEGEPLIAKGAWSAAYLPARPFPLPHVAASLALLAAAGASFGLFCAMAAMGAHEVTAFVSKNVLSGEERMRMLLAFAAGLVGPAAVGAAVALRGGAGGAAAVRRVADLAAPLAASALVPSLLSYQAWYAKPLPYLVQLVLFVALLEFGARRAAAALPDFFADGAGRLAARWGRPLRGRGALVVVVLAAAAYAWFAARYTLLSHRRFATASFDLGINVNWMYNALHGQPFRCTVLYGPNGGNFIANHAILASYFLWLPFYALKPGAEVFLIYQAVLMGFAAVPLYLFASTQLPRLSAAVVALAYLMFAPMHGPNFYDFHELPIAVFFHFSLYYAIAKRRYALAWAAVVVIFLVREDTPVGLAVLGIFLLVSGLRPRFGLALAVASVAWFITIKFIIMPAAGTWWFANIYQDLMPAGERSYGGIIKTLATNPAFVVRSIWTDEKLTYFLHLFAPLALLPARRPGLLFLAAPGAFFTLLTTGYAPTLSIAFQYTTHWIPYLFAASVLALRLLGEGPGGVARRRGALATMAAAVLLHSYVFGAILQRNTFVGGFQKVEFSMSPAEEQRYREFKEIAALIPPEASVTSTEGENAHLAARMTSYSLRMYQGDSDYMLLHKPQMGGTTTSLARDAFSRNPYGLVARVGAYFLFKKGHDSPETAAAKAELGLATAGQGAGRGAAPPPPPPGAPPFDAPGDSPPTAPTTAPVRHPPVP